MEKIYAVLVGTGGELDRIELKEGEANAEGLGYTAQVIDWLQTEKIVLAEGDAIYIERPE